jgi:hypothetical protein
MQTRPPPASHLVARPLPLLTLTSLPVFLNAASFGCAGYPHPDPASADLPDYQNLKTNLTTRNYPFVRFYDGHSQLVYEERLPQLCLNLGKGSCCCRQRTQALQLALHDLAHAAQATAAVWPRLPRGAAVCRALKRRPPHYRPRQFSLKL